jgi:hypothetical protein
MFSLSLSMELSTTREAPSCEATFPAFYGTRRFYTEFTRAFHLFLSWARPIQSTSPHPNSKISILILSTHLRLALPSGIFPTNNLHALLFPHSGYMPGPRHSPWLDYSNYTWRRVQITKLLIMQLSPLSRHLISLRFKYPPRKIKVRISDIRKRFRPGAS